MATIRPAIPQDIEGIMALEVETFGPLGEGAMAHQTMMEKRITLCNQGEYQFFWVAIKQKGVVAYIILQPTSLTQKECTSWGAATDDGTLQKTFDPTGPNLYVVSLAESKRAPIGTTELLLHASAVVWVKRGGLYMFCSRIPGFAKAHRETGIKAEQYWRLTRSDGGPRDPMLRYYWSRSGGGSPLCLLPNGFPPDKESMGHGVFFALHDPYQALHALGQLLHDLGKPKKMSD